MDELRNINSLALDELVRKAIYEKAQVAIDQLDRKLINLHRTISTLVVNDEETLGKCSELRTEYDKLMTLRIRCNTIGTFKDVTVQELIDNGIDIPRTSEDDFVYPAILKDGCC